MKFKHLIAIGIGAIFLLGVAGAQSLQPAQAQQRATATASAVAAPTSATLSSLPTGWVRLELLATSTGPRVCPPGVERTGWIEDKVCNGKPGVTLDEFARLLAVACPGTAVVSAMPYWIGTTASRVVVGFRETGPACSNIAGISPLGWMHRTKVHD